MTGVWGMWGGDIVLRWKAISPEGQTWEGASVFRRGDDNTMKLDLCEQDSYGDPVSPPRSTISFKRKK